MEACPVPGLSHTRCFRNVSDLQHLFLVPCLVFVPAETSKTRKYVLAQSAFFSLRVARSAVSFSNNAGVQSCRGCCRSHFRACEEHGSSLSGLLSEEGTEQYGQHCRFWRLLCLLTLVFCVSGPVSGSAEKEGTGAADSDGGHPELGGGRHYDPGQRCVHVPGRGPVRRE